MPAAIAIPLAIGAGTAVAGVAGAKISANAAENAAKQQTSAANYGADQQLKAQEDALAEQKAEAAQTQANYAAAQRANYNQYAARATAARNLGLSSLGFDIGAPAPYVDTTTASLSSTPTAPASGTTTAGAQPSASFGNLTDPQAWMGLVGNDAQLASWVKSQNPGLSSDLVTYYVGKIKGQPGANPTEQAGSAQYWATKIASDPTTGGGSAPAASAAALASPTIASYLPTAAPRVAPVLANPISAYLRN